MLLLFGDWRNVVDWALEFTHATKDVLYATPIMPTYIPPIPNPPVPVCGRFIRDGRASYH